MSVESPGRTCDAIMIVPLEKDLARHRTEMDTVPVWRLMVAYKTPTVWLVPASQRNRFPRVAFATATLNAPAVLFVT